MILYLLRHAIALSRDEWRESDRDRPLSSKGEQIMRRIADRMLEIPLSFDLILSSPYRRAEQTANIVASTFKLKSALQFTDHLTPDGDSEELIRSLTSLHPLPDSILLVGHEPYLSQLASTLVVGTSDLPLTLKKAGLVKLSIGSLRYRRCATLEWLLAPGVLLDGRE